MTQLLWYRETWSKNGPNKIVTRRVRCESWVPLFGLFIQRPQGRKPGWSAVPTRTHELFGVVWLRRYVSLCRRIPDWLLRFCEMQSNPETQQEHLDMKRKHDWLIFNDHVQLPLRRLSQEPIHLDYHFSPQVPSPISWTPANYTGCQDQSSSDNLPICTDEWRNSSPTLYYHLAFLSLAKAECSHTLRIGGVQVYPQVWYPDEPKLAVRTDVLPLPRVRGRGLCRYALLSFDVE